MQIQRFSTGTVVQVGLQEKTTFLQLGKGLKNPQLRTAIMVLPALLQLLIAALGTLVLFAHSGIRPMSVKARQTDDSVLLETEGELSTS